MLNKLRLLLIGFIALAVVLGTSAPVAAQDETPEPAEVEDGEGEGVNPVVEFLSGVTGEDVAVMQEGGAGLGTIAKAYAYMQASGETNMEQVMTRAREEGWGNLYKQAWEDGMSPGKKHGLGWLMSAEKAQGPKDKGSEWQGGPPDHANKDKDKIPPGQAKDKKGKPDHAGADPEDDGEGEEPEN